MKFALEVWSNDWDQAERTCQLAERLGYTAFYYGESPTGLNLECWTALAALARSTRTIRIGPVIANLLPSYRSLALVAKQAATVSLIAEGRLDFRTGAGASKRYADPWWEPFGVDYPPYAARSRLVERSVPLLRALWAGGSAAFGSGAGPSEVALGFGHPPIPITIAAVGPTGLSCAARHADVWEASYRTADEFAELSSRLDGMQGKTARRIGRSLEVDVFVGETPDELAAVLARVERERGRDRADRVIERSLHGTPSDVAGQLARLRAAGVEQLVLAFQDPHDPSALEAFARAMEVFARSEGA